MQPPNPSSPVAVLGLGPMGAAIARSVALAGHPVNAWNRTARSLVDHGLDGVAAIDLAASPNDAVAAADVVVICVRDHTVSRELVAQIAPVVGDAVVVDVSTGTPTETTGSAALATKLGVRYVTGAVMVPTPMVGTDDCVVLYAGAPADLAAAEPLLSALGGTSDILGEDPAEPPALDLAMLDIYFAGMYAFLHAAALAHAHGIDTDRFLPYAEGIVATLRGSLPDLAAAVQKRTYDTGEARLDMCLAFLDHIVATSTDAGIAPGPSEVVRDASARALTRWPAGTDWDVVAEDLHP